MFVVEYGFATINQNGQLHFDEEMKMRVLNLDETNMSLDGSNGNRGGRPTATYYDVRFPQLGKATSKSALTTMMISGSNAPPPGGGFSVRAETTTHPHLPSTPPGVRGLEGTRGQIENH